MKSDGLTVGQLAEIQAWMSVDAGTDQKTNPRDLYQTALKKIKTGQSVSGWTPPKDWKSGEYVAAIDIDETLGQQWMRWNNRYRNIFSVIEGVSPDTQRLSNGQFSATSGNSCSHRGAENTLLRLIADPKCRGLVVFSAKRPDSIVHLLYQWLLSDGKRANSVFKGVFDRRHLLLSRNGTPMKDLRIIDPTLQHVVLIDNNPNRCLQPELVMRAPQFEAELYLKGNRPEDGSLAEVAERIVQLSDLAQSQNLMFGEILRGGKAIPQTNVFLYLDDLTHCQAGLALTGYISELPYCS